MTHTAKNYGGALYDLAKEENLTEQILSDLKLVCSVMDENSDYLRLLCTPSVLKPERQLDGSVKFHLEQVQKLLKNTVL